MRLWFFVILLALCGARVSQAQLISDYYHRVSGPDSFIADPTNQGYVVTRSYSGPIEVVVSGTWTPDAFHANDAWYEYRNDGVLGWTPTHNGYGFCVGFSGCSWHNQCSPGGDHVCNWTEFIENMGPVGHCVPYIPNFSPAHEYHFVVNFGSVPLPVTTFGTGGQGSSGGLNVTLYQLQPGPEPPTPTIPYTWSAIKARHK